jgi:hypothetical protein
LLLLLLVLLLLLTRVVWLSRSEAWRGVVIAILRVAVPALR